MSQCKECGRELTANDMGLYMKLINRGAREFMCIDCLANFLQCDVVLLEKKIVHFKNMGCTLF